MNCRSRAPPQRPPLRVDNEVNRRARPTAVLLALRGPVSSNPLRDCSRFGRELPVSPREVLFLFVFVVASPPRHRTRTATRRKRHATDLACPAARRPPRRRLPSRHAARDPWLCRDGRTEHHAAPLAQTSRGFGAGGFGAGGLGAGGARPAGLPLPRSPPASPPPAVPPCRSDARRRGRSTHCLHTHDAAETRAFHLTRPPAHHRRPGATRAPGVRPAAWDEEEEVETEERERRRTDDTDGGTRRLPLRPAWQQEWVAGTSELTPRGTANTRETEYSVENVCPRIMSPIL